jgi:hypothetical protein
MGRFISCGYLSNKFHILTSLQFSIACLHDRKKYYEAFSLASDIRNKGDLTVFIIMFLEIFLNGLLELKENPPPLGYSILKGANIIDTPHITEAGNREFSIYDCDGRVITFFVKRQ